LKGWIVAFQILFYALKRFFRCGLILLRFINKLILKISGKYLYGKVNEARGVKV
jgi:hypothetical protein